MNLTIIKQVLLMRRKSLLCLAAFFVLSIGIRTYIVYFQEPQLDVARTEWNNMRAAEKLGKSSGSKESIYKNGKLDLVKLRQRIYSKDHFARFIVELYEISGKNSLEIASLTYKPELVKDENVYKYSIILTSGGKYINQKKFLRDLSVADNLIHIDAISFASQGNSSEKVQLQAHISAYFKVEAQ